MRSSSMEESNQKFTPPKFVEFPPSTNIAVIKEGEKTSIDITYISPEGRQLTARFVLNPEQTATLVRDLT